MPTTVEKFIFNNTKTSHKRWESMVMYALHYALRDVKLLSQYPVGKYFIDGYFPDLKIAVEIDEPYHERTREQDAIREEYITSELGCHFFRINVNEPVYDQIDKLTLKINELNPPRWEIQERVARKNIGEYSQESLTRLTEANAFEFLEGIQEEVEQLGICVDTEEVNRNTLPNNGMISFNVIFGALKLTVFTRSTCKPKIIVSEFNEPILNKLGIRLSEPSKTNPPYWKIIDLDKQLSREETVSYLSNLSIKFKKQSPFP